MAKPFDLFVIGAGSGGVRAARLASQAGAKTAIAEKDRIGGTCVIRGCIPKKLLSYAAHYEEEIELAQSFGWQIGASHFSWQKLIANKDKEIERLSAIYERNLNLAGVEIFKNAAFLEGENSVRLDDGRVIEADKILIATGGAPKRLNIKGADHAISSDEAFHLDDLPRHIIVIGGGYIAVEFASIFNGLGCETILAYRGASILRGFDGALRKALEEEMTKKGVDIRLNHQPEQIIKNDKGSYEIIFDNGRSIQTDLVMFATGRAPNVKDLALESAKIATKDNGAIIVNPYGQTSCQSIYAIGDVTDYVNLTPVAIRQAVLFAHNLFNEKKKILNDFLVPSAVFSHPPLGVIGLSEEDARQHYDDIDIYQTSFTPLKKTLSDKKGGCLMKLVVERKSDKIIGAHLMGEEAAEMVQLLAIAFAMGATKAQFDAVIAVHPTSAEELVTMTTPIHQSS